MSKSSKPNPKALAEARAYIPNKLRFCLFDCSDSMEEAQKHLDRFEALTNDKIKIGQFIKDHLLAEWREGFKKICADETDTFDDLMKNGWTVCRPPKPLDDIALLKN